MANDNGNDAKEVILYRPSEGEPIALLFDGDSRSVWVTRKDMARGFRRDVDTIGRHWTAVLAEGELDAESVTAKYSVTASDGKTYEIEHGNFEMLCAIGYRVKSKEGIAFRRFATKCMRERIDGQAFDERRVAAMIDEKIGQVLAVVQEMMARLLAERAAPVMLEAGSVTITAKQYDELSNDVRTIAMLEVAAGDWPERVRRRSATPSADQRRRPRTPVERAMSGIWSSLADNPVIAWGRKARPWRNLPALKLPEVKAVLAGRLADVRRKLGGMDSARRAMAEQSGQLDIFEVFTGKKRGDN